MQPVVQPVVQPVGQTAVSCKRGVTVSTNVQVMTAALTQPKISAWRPL